MCYAELMALFKYFKHEDSVLQAVLSDPDGSLSLTVPSSSIEAVNTSVKPIVKKTLNIIDDEDSKTSEKDKRKRSMRAAEHGVLATIRHFSEVYQDHPLKERDWKNNYNHEVLKLRKAGKDKVVRELIHQK